MRPSTRAFFVATLAAGAFACNEAREAPKAAAPPAAPKAALGPNADAAHYGPHGVSAVPAAAMPAAPAGQAGSAPPLPAGGMNVADMAGHPCTCGGTCHCGHCSGMVAGCHCKPKRADEK